MSILWKMLRLAGSSAGFRRIYMLLQLPLPAATAPFVVREISLRRQIQNTHTERSLSRAFNQPGAFLGSHHLQKAVFSHQPRLLPHLLPHLLMGRLTSPRGGDDNGGLGVLNKISNFLWSAATMTAAASAQFLKGSRSLLFYRSFKKLPRFAERQQGE